MFVFHIICTNNIYAYGWFIHMFLFLVTFMHLELLTLFLFFLWDIARRGEYCWCSYEKILYRCWKCVPDVVSPLTRQPFCPISSTVSSKANVAFAANDTHNEKLQKTLVVSNFPSITTSKTTTVVDKRTKLQRAVSIPDPTTP